MKCDRNEKKRKSVEKNEHEEKCMQFQVKMQFQVFWKKQKKKIQNRTSKNYYVTTNITYTSCMTVFKSCWSFFSLIFVYLSYFLIYLFFFFRLYSATCNNNTYMLYTALYKHTIKWKRIWKYYGKMHWVKEVNKKQTA